MVVVAKIVVALTTPIYIYIYILSKYFYNSITFD